jgi:hypothetical protein
MTILRAALLEFLVCYHVIGGAVLFRRLFPRESPWLGFFVPMLALVTALNFIEHFVALPDLGLMLPLTMGGLFWCFVNSRGSWDGLRLPAALFAVTFTYGLFLRGLHPEIPYWTEGMSDYARILDYCLGERLPPTDSWLPPFDHAGYYTFQHYAASVLKRLLMVDVGTSYNLGYVLVDALICLAAAAVGQALSGRSWIAVATLVIVAASFPGSTLIMALFGPVGFDPWLALDMHHGWADQHHNPMWKLLDADPYQVRTRLFPPGDGFYVAEFHPTWGGHLLTLLALWVVVEVARPARSNQPWILLLVLPFIAVITSTWYVPVVVALCAGGAILAWVMGRRPENGRVALGAAAMVLLLIWPTLALFLADAPGQGFHLTTKEEHTWPWLFIEQWWPVYLPWLLLVPVWLRLDAPARLLHAGLALLLIAFEIFTIGDRQPMVEKIWSQLFAAGLVAFWPMVLMQRGWIFRGATLLVLFASAVSFRAWWMDESKGAATGDDFMRLNGDRIMRDDPQKRRLVQVAQRLHGATFLSGKPNWGYALAPAVAEFSENRSFVGWTAREELAGRGIEADDRASFARDFYDGKVNDPLPPLHAQKIDAVLIFPDDAIPDDLLARLQRQLAPEFDYIDCRSGGSDNAGLFMRREASSGGG